MKKLFRNSTHNDRLSHDCLVVELNGKKVKLTYTSENASEGLSVQVFDGYKFNYILSMLDMGITPNNSSYIWNEQKRKNRADELFKVAEKLCKSIL